MLRTIAIPAVIAVLSTGVATDTSAWERKGSFVGPRGGTATVDGSGSCSGGACSRSITKTGPQGFSASRQGSGSCSGGSCSGNRTTTGPRGQSWTRQGSLSR